MKLHYFQHVPFEGPGSVSHWAAANKHELSVPRWHLGETPPPLSDIDLLLVMGGPMSVHDTDRYPWLAKENAYLHSAIEANQAVLGICLGAQLLADALGAEITRNEHPEIGWFPVTRSEQLRHTGLQAIIPPVMEAFHWHGETFTLPHGCTPVAASAACVNQGFLFSDRVIGLQFHLEMTMASTSVLIDNCRDEMVAGKYIQTQAQMLAQADRFQRANLVMAGILEYLERLCA